jgi:hypothetical protein
MLHCKLNQRRRAMKLTADSVDVEASRCVVALNRALLLREIVLTAPRRRALRISKMRGAIQLN